MVRPGSRCRVTPACALFLLANLASRGATAAPSPLVTEAYGSPVPTLAALQRLASAAPTENLTPVRVTSAGENVTLLVRDRSGERCSSTRASRPASSPSGPGL